MAASRTCSGQATRASGSDVGAVTEVIERESGDAEDSEFTVDSDPVAESAVARLRERGERVRRQELDAALGKLEARGEVTPVERAILARLSARLTDALVERWAAALADGTDPETALELLTES